MSSDARTGRGPRAVTTPVALAWAVLAVAGVAAALALTASPAAGPSGGPPGALAGLHFIHEDVPTGFGAIAVEVLRKDVSPGSPASSPATTSPDLLRIRVTISAHNARPRPITLRADHLSLLAGGRRYRHVRATAERVWMQPDAHLDDVVSFTVPRHGEALVLELADPSAGHPVRIALGRAQARVPDPVGHDHTTP